MNPPQLLPALIFVCSLTRSSLVFGSRPTKSNPDICRPVVRIVSLVMPLRSPLIMVSLLTSQIPSIMVLIAELKDSAELFTVVNMA